MRRSIQFLVVLFFVIFLLNQGSLNASPEEYNSAPTPQINSFPDGDEILVHTLLADYLFSTKGGSFRSAYIHFNPIGTPPAELVPDTDTTKNAATGQLTRSYVREPLFPFDLIFNETPTSDLLFEHRSVETADHKLEVRFTTEIDGFELSKIYVLSENPNYSMDFGVEIENKRSTLAELPQGIKLSLGRGVGHVPVGSGQTLYLYGDELKDRPLDSPGFGGLGFKNAGLIFFLKPGVQTAVFPYENQTAEQGKELGVEIPSLMLLSGERAVYSFLLYAGREKFTLLEAVGLGKVSPPDFFSQLIIAIVQLLEWLYNLTGNYGWAIILFTLILRIVLFPLTRQQFHSMVKMAEIKPKFEKIQQRYPTMRRLKELHPNMSQDELFKRDRENRRALQEKMMEFYREEKVNPLGGCLPMLIQLPILLILWQSVLYSAEAIHFSPGFLWIDDLSLHDPLYILVALTAVAMVLQTKTTPQMSTQQGGPNPMVFMLLSVGLMVVLLKDFPAGLWLYYFLTTIIQVGQQVFINWEIAHKAKQKAALAAASGNASSTSSVIEPTTSTDGKESK